MYNFLPDAFFVFQFPPPLAEEAEVHLSQVFEPQTPCLLWEANFDPFDQVIFSFHAPPLPEESLSSFVHSFDDSFWEEVHRHNIDWDAIQASHQQG